METIISPNRNIEARNQFSSEIQKGMNIINAALVSYNIDDPENNICFMWHSENQRWSICLGEHHWPKR